MFGNRLHTFALITTVVALAAYCWLAGTIFEPRICIDSKHLESVTVNVPSRADAAAHSLVLVGRGLCTPRAPMTTAEASRVEELSSEFSDLERFADWIKRPFGNWNVKLKIGGDGSHWNSGSGEWQISQQLWENPQDRRVALVQFWLNSHDLTFSNFLASKIWPGSPQRDADETSLVTRAFSEVLVGLDSRLWIDSQTVLYRAVVDSAHNPPIDHPISNSPAAHAVAKQLEEFFKTLLAPIPDGELRNRLLAQVQVELHSWLNRIELRPVVLRYHQLGRDENSDPLSETSRDSFRLIDLHAATLDPVLSNLATFHNRLVIQIEAPIPLSELLKLQPFTRSVLIVAEGGTSGLLDFYDTYFRLGTQTFAAYDHGADFLELSLPALAIAVHNGVDAGYRLSAREDFRHPRTVTVARLVDPSSAVVPIEYFRKKTVSATITN
jgi:hypothetical protein